MYRDEQTGMFSAPSLGMVQQLWMDVQQFEEAGALSMYLAPIIICMPLYRYSARKLNILPERFYWPSRR